MRSLRTGTPQPEKWEAEDVMAYLSCDKTTADKIMQDCRNRHGIKGYGVIEKHLLLDFINEKQREEREREARHLSDIANAETAATLKEQVKTLKEEVSVLREMSRASSEDALKAREQSRIASIISFGSMIIALLSLILK
ncbi:MAG: hypothetical protein K2J29_02020 [Muribaculaceae bacterium]|nr:hypothetical protein [Muribaculaceae bacterium]